MSLWRGLHAARSIVWRNADDNNRTEAPTSTPANDPATQFAQPAVWEFVAGARVAHLATADGGGAPHNVPFCYWFDGERLYFAIDEKPKRQKGLALKRMRNISENPRVAVVIDHYEEDWPQLAYVLIRGVARVVEDPEEYLRRDASFARQVSAVSRDEHDAGR